jgi:hypothetical protein
MREFRIEKTKARVTLKLRDGLEISGRVFLPREPEDEPYVGKLQALLNDAEPFIPVEIEGGEPFVQNKDRVAWCRYDGPVGPVVEVTKPRRRVTLVLDDGSQLQGDLVAEGPPERRRVLDCLNLAPPFLLLETAHGDYLVRKDTISLVPSSEAGESPSEADTLVIETEEGVAV